MNASRLASVVALTLSVLSATCASAQNGGGFPRPLSDSPRSGNPGASPQISMAGFIALMEHWADFDADKDKQIAKSEVPELFAAQFAQADVNKDGKLDEKELTLLAKPQPVAQQSAAPRRGPPPRPGMRRPPLPPQQ